MEIPVGNGPEFQNGHTRKHLGTLNSTRASRLKRFLQANHLQGWVAWRPDELLMMSGYFPYWGASVLLYLKDADPVLFVPQIEPRDLIPAGLRIREYPWGGLMAPEPFAILIAALREEVARAGGVCARVGVLLESARASLPIMAGEQPPIPSAFVRELCALAAPAQAPVEAAFLELYSTKEAEEIERIRLANRVAGEGIRAFREALVPGVREAEVAASVESAIQKQTGQPGIFYARGWAMVQSGPNTADAGCFNRSTGRPLESGDLALLELATCLNGYWSDLTRTVIVGHGKPEAQRILAVVEEAQKAAVARVAPGVAAGAIDSAARQIIARHGLAEHFTHGTGHHVGFRYHDPGFGLVPGETQLLGPGMVITVEPGIYVREFEAGARIEDNVLVTETGHEVLSQE